MNRMVHHLLDFHSKFHVPVGNCELLAEERAKVRIGFIEEELTELKEASEKRDIVGVSDALGDILYVTIGMAVEMGLPIETIFDEIQRSNMTKLGSDGKPIIQPPGKIMKGPNYEPPNIEDILLEYNLL